MAEQTMVALLWQQGDARGTLNLPAATKVEDLKLRLNASDCDAVMFDAVIISCGAFLAAKEQSTRPWLAVVWPGSRAKGACPH